MIKWHEVTWYSRWGAIFLFLVIVPVLCFYIGTQYQSTVDAAHTTLIMTQPSTKNILPGAVQGTSSDALSTSTVTLLFKERGQDPQNDLPLNDVSFTFAGRNYFIGQVDGNCNKVEKGHADIPVPPEDITDLRCSFTESSILISIYKDNNSIVVRTRSEEVNEGAPGPPYGVGKFRTILTVPLTNTVIRGSSF